MSYSQMRVAGANHELTRLCHGTRMVFSQTSVLSPLEYTVRMKVLPYKALWRYYNLLALWLFVVVKRSDFALCSLRVGICFSARAWIGTDARLSWTWSGNERSVRVSVMASVHALMFQLKVNSTKGIAARKTTFLRWGILSKALTHSSSRRKFVKLSWPHCSIPEFCISPMGPFKNQIRRLQAKGTLLLIYVPSVAIGSVQLNTPSHRIYQLSIIHCLWLCWCFMFDFHQITSNHGDTPRVDYLFTHRTNLTFSFQNPPLN